MTHAEVLQFGRERLPTSHFVKYLDDAAKIGLDTEFIVTGFGQGGDDFIVEVRQNTVSMPDAFACIGEGEFLARSSLLHRGMSTIRRFGAALYEVYEAKKAAERVNSVGKYTLLSVLHEDGGGARRTVNLDKMEYLNRLYSEYGPKVTPPDIPVPDDLFDPERLTTRGNYP